METKLNKPLLVIHDLNVAVANKQVLFGINLTVGKGQTYVIMGPNGSGKSTLASTIMGHPDYQVIRGVILLGNQDLAGLAPDQRARQGLFLAFQQPLEVEGLPLKDFLRQAHAAINKDIGGRLNLKQFNQLLDEKLKLLKMDKEFVARDLNVGCSGGEKKRAEMLQLAVLEPKLAILDEIDSGLDLDAIRDVFGALGVIKRARPAMSLVIITHNPRVLDFLEVDRVHVLQRGVITQSGGPELAKVLEVQGFE